jgi:5-methylcytosine-specific restriction endonuclease McrA
VTDDGKRCEARAQLQFDHIKPLGKGGGWATENVRLLCPAHNQLAAEHEYGAGFMHRIRERARGAAETRRERQDAPENRTAASAMAPPAPA